MMMGLTNVVVILRWLSFVSFVVKYLTKLTFRIFKIDSLVIVLKLVCWFRSFENLKINIVVKMPPKKLKKMSEEKNRYHLYRMSQSPQQRENRLRGERVRWQSKISSERSEINDERVKNVKILKRNLRDESSDEIPTEIISVVETPQKMSNDNLEEKVRFREYRSSQSPMDRDDRLNCQRNRMKLNRSSESSEIRAKRLEKMKLSIRNIRDKSSHDKPLKSV